MIKLKCPSCNSEFIKNSTWLRKYGFSHIEDNDVICGMCGHSFKVTRKEKVVFT